MSNTYYDLAVTGLPAFDVNAKEGEIQLKFDTIGDATQQLENYITQLDDQITDMETQEKDLISDWESESRNVVEEYFPQLIELFRQLPDALRALTSNTNTYAEIQAGEDKGTAAALRRIFSGELV